MKSNKNEFGLPGIGLLDSRNTGNVHEARNTHFRKQLNMERLNQFDFYKMAKNLIVLATYDDDTPPGEIFVELVNARNTISVLLDGKPVPLGVSRPAAEALSNDIEGLVNSYLMVDTDDGKREWKFPDADDPAIPAWRFHSYKHLLETFETVFSAEMAEATSYFIPQKGIFSTPSLVDRADDSFPIELQDLIPEKTKADWRAAGRCLALNLCTAAGFHTVRAVEAMLEIYFQTFTNQPSKTKNGWNDYLVELEKAKIKIVPPPSEKTLAAIRQMKDDFRNPVVHPRVVLSESDARMLFNNGESAIIGMAQDVQNVEGGIQENFELDELNKD